MPENPIVVLPGLRSRKFEIPERHSAYATHYLARDNDFFESRSVTLWLSGSEERKKRTATVVAPKALAHLEPPIAELRRGVCDATFADSS
jgi:hypothetical protein